jgi:hypothetical protein
LAGRYSSCPGDDPQSTDQREGRSSEAASAAQKLHPLRAPRTGRSGADGHLQDINRDLSVYGRR